MEKPDMEKIAFKMQLKPGAAVEYERRHNEIWPELMTLLKNAGIADYSIFLDDATGALFAVLWRADDHRMDALPGDEVMRRWWAFMADLMETNPDKSPVATPLRKVFHLP
jgi:L-rhamnose mutarotase